MSKKLKSIKLITKISILAVLSFLLCYFYFPLPFAPAFYRMDFSSVPVLIGGFAFGPVVAVVIEIIKIILKLIFIPTDSFFIGELSLIIVNLSFVIPASLIYKLKKTNLQAILALVMGIFCSVLISVISNYFLIIPAYIKILNIKVDDILILGKAFNQNVNSMFDFVIYITVPFNLFKSVLIAFVVKLVYKHLSYLLKKNN